MSIVTNIINVYVPEKIFFDLPESQKHYSKVTLKRFFNNKNISINNINGQITVLNPNIRVNQIHIKLLSIVTDIIKSIIMENYIPPTTDLSYDSAGTIIVTSPLTVENDFISFILNEPLNDYSLIPIHKENIKFISKKIIGLFIRVKNHILTSNSTNVVCENSNEPRLFYMLIENCIFDLEFYYN